MRVTCGEPYTAVREYDFSSYYPEDKYIRYQDVPDGKVFDIRDFGADTGSTDNSDAINQAVDAASAVSGTVLISGGDYLSGTVVLKSGVTLFIDNILPLPQDLTAKICGKSRR